MDNLTDEQKQRLAEAGQAVMNMSHGIKNVVQALRSGQDVMDEALDRDNIEVAKRTWGILKENIHRIEKLSLDMLKFSKDEPLNLQSFNFNHYIESVVESVRPQADRLKIEVILQTDQRIGSMTLDPEKMRDVIINLLFNAIEAVEPETGQVTINTELDDRGQRVILRVKDNGPGIEDTGVIFEPFHSTKGSAGSGLGLTIAQKAAQLHGGTIDVQSIPGEGSVFAVHIPINTTK